MSDWQRASDFMVSEMKSDLKREDDELAVLGPLEPRLAVGLEAGEGREGVLPLEAVLHTPRNRPTLTLLSCM